MKVMIRRKEGAGLALTVKVCFWRNVWGVVTRV
jgi:hypothetical protein